MRDLPAPPSSPPPKVLRLGRCPQCGSSSRLDLQNPWRPFCSERCKMIDLGDWLEGRHSIEDNL